MNLPAWLAQAQAQCKEGDVPIVIHKKRGTADMGKSYVTTDLENFLSLLELMSSPETQSLDKDALVQSFSKMLDDLQSE